MKAPHQAKTDDADGTGIECLRILHTGYTNASIRIVYSPPEESSTDVADQARGSSASGPDGRAEPAEQGDRAWSSEPERVYELLRDDLTAGLYLPREPLVESDLAERYATSRTPVRSALGRLVGDRLVETRPHMVSIVRETTARDVRQIYEVRQALEGFAAEAVVGVIDRARLEVLLASYDTVSPSGGTAAPSDVAADMGIIPLHFLITKALGNGRLTDLLLAESLPLRRLHALYWRMANPRVDASAAKRRRAAVEEHRDIAQALLAGSGEQARSLVVVHLQNAADYLISLMASIDLDPSNFNTERGSSNREAVALDHMIPGLPAQRPERRTP